MKKRIMSFAVALMMILSMLPTAAYAAEPVSITVGTATVEPGKTVTVDVNIAGASAAALMAAYFEADFDAALTLDSVKLSDAATQVGFTFGQNNLPEGVIQIDGAASGSNIGDGVFFTMEFTASETANGSYPVSLNFLDGMEENVNDGNDAVPCTFNAGSVTVATVPTDPNAYTAKLSAELVNVNVGETFDIYLGADKDFAATEITLTYDPALVEFVPAANTSYSIKAAAGELKLADYGVDKTAADNIYALTFKANVAGEATFNITKAGFGTGTSAEDKNLFQAAPVELGVTIEEKTHTVTVKQVEGKDIFNPSGENIVVDGGSFTFGPETATGAYYNYNTITVTMGDATVTATRNDDGTYTISNPDVLSYADGKWTIAAVTGDVTVSGTRTAKTYGVTVEYKYTDGIGEVTLPEGVVPTYGENYTFYIPVKVEPTTVSVGYTYSAAVTVGGSSVSPDVNDTAYMITGTEITGDIVITVSRVELPITEAPQVNVKIEGSTDVTFEGYDETDIYVAEGSDVTLVLKSEPGYNYTVEVNGEDVTEDFENGEYTFSANEETTIVVTKTVDTTYVEVAEYVTMKNSQTMWLVMISHDESNAQLEGKTYTYGGEQMLWSSKYNAYCYLVVAPTEPAVEDMIFAIIPVDQIPAIVYDSDVNESENDTVDANDAQLVYNMYNVTYEGFTTTVDMNKFFKADIVAGATEGTTTYLGTPDAAAIIAEILG